MEIVQHLLFCAILSIVAAQSDPGVDENFISVIPSLRCAPNGTLVVFNFDEGWILFNDSVPAGYQLPNCSRCPVCESKEDCPPCYLRQVGSECDACDPTKPWAPQPPQSVIEKRTSSFLESKYCKYLLSEERCSMLTCQGKHPCNKPIFLPPFSFPKRPPGQHCGPHHRPSHGAHRPPHHFFSRHPPPQQFFTQPHLHPFLLPPSAPQFSPQRRLHPFLLPHPSQKFLQQPSFPQLPLLPTSLPPSPSTLPSMVNDHNRSFPSAKLLQSKHQSE